MIPNGMTYVGGPKQPKLLLHNTVNWRTPAPHLLRRLFFVNFFGGAGEG